MAVNAASFVRSNANVRMPAPVSDLVLLPQRQLRLFLLQFLRTFHHKVDNVDAASQKQQHQDVS